ncbi:hypothetical protein BDV24DRAFT_22171 [Aspergillus arachidicola]|uniref:Uncharacterized protein n=1 Tax=Aspergillus arachidicola TaxID=656916 RepID=A0A5N6XN31_9EURO|nr:hypothetical protein BDV24DRAFT_22171 [Aspergillus arachidicola]
MLHLYVAIFRYSNRPLVPMYLVLNSCLFKFLSRRARNSVIFLSTMRLVSFHGPGIFNFLICQGFPVLFLGAGEFIFSEKIIT